MVVQCRGTTYTANLPTSNGATTIDVAGSTFTDASGNNNSAATQFNWTFDSSAPTISGNTIASDNSTIAVTFSEAVYNTNGGSGVLQTSDFSLSLTGGMSHYLAQPHQVFRLAVIPIR